MKACLALTGLLVGAPLAGQGSNAHPSVSPDGQWIAFDSDRSGNGDIYVMRADGSGVRRLTDHPAMEMGGEWWENGQAIVFTRYEGGPEPTWYRVSSDGSDLAPLPDPRRVHWAESPDGTLLLTGPLADGEPSHIWVQRADGSGRRPLTRFRPSSFNSDMSFSPDGRTVVYESFIGTVDTGEIFVVPLDGGTPRSLARGTDPKWSPDGRHIAYKVHDTRTDRYWLHVMESDGSNDRVLAEGTIPSWFPDAGRLAFMAPTESGWQIHVVRIDTGEIERLTR